jgi:hypothetical protein
MHVYCRVPLLRQYYECCDEIRCLEAEENLIQEDCRFFIDHLENEEKKLSEVIDAEEPFAWSSADDEALRRGAANFLRQQRQEIYLLRQSIIN